MIKSVLRLCFVVTLSQIAPPNAHAQAVVPASTPTGPSVWGANFSPDGRQIVYQIQVEKFPAAAQLHIINLDGTNDREIALAPGTGPQGAWFSPNGQRIAYFSLTGNPATGPVIQLVTVGADGSEPRVVARNGGFAPAWSPDGRTLLFASVKAFKPGSMGVSLVNADGSGLLELSTGLTGFQSGAWSPDDQQILFSAPTSTGSTIMIANRDGSARSQLVQRPLHQIAPIWSPDGRLIAFFGADSVGIPQGGLPPPGMHLYVMNVDGTGLRQVIVNADGVTSLSFSPDSKTLLFADRRGGKASNIFVINVDGTNERVLVNWPGTDENPRWSPDGKLILFQSSADPQGRTPHVFIMNPDGSGLRVVK